MYDLTNFVYLMKDNIQKNVKEIQYGHVYLIKYVEISISGLYCFPVILLIFQYSYQWLILIRNSGAVEQYNAALCAVPLDLNCRSGFVTDEYKAL
jgi:hypothetical protein